MILPPLLVLSIAGCIGPDDPPRVEVETPPEPTPPAIERPAPVVLARAVAVEFVAGQGDANVRYLVTFEPAALPREGALDARGDYRIDDDLDRPVALNDRGQGADRVAGDGVWSGFGHFDARGWSERMTAWTERLALRGEPAVASFVRGRSVLAQAQVAPAMVPAKEVARAPETVTRALDVPTVSLETASTQPLPMRIPDFDVPAAELEGRVFRIFPVEGLVGLEIETRGLIVTGIPPTTTPTKTEAVVHSTVLTDPARTYLWCGGTGTANGTGVGTPNGVWTFRHAMEGLAGGNGAEARQMVTDWMSNWASDQTVNGQLVPAADSAIQQEVLARWQADSGGTLLDLDKAPFKLVAIMNRLDLAGGSAYGGEAGEGRLVFSLVDTSQSGCPLERLLTPPNPERPLTVIFEYGLPFSGCFANRGWAKDWIALNALDQATPAYRDALAALTERFVAAGVAPGRPNGSALNQLRVNDFAFRDPAGPNWDLREFTLQVGVGGTDLVPATVKQTPGDDIAAATVNSFITANAGPIGTDFHGSTHTVPTGYPGATDAFLGGYADYALFDVWGQAGLGYSEATRHAFGMGTCDGCHSAETDTPFLMIDPRPASIGGATALADLADFLTGDAMPKSVPRGCGTASSVIPTCTSETFDELDLRASDLDARAADACFVLNAPILSAVMRTKLIH